MESRIRLLPHDPCADPIQLLGIRLPAVNHIRRLPGALGMHGYDGFGIGQFDQPRYGVDIGMAAGGQELRAPSTQSFEQILIPMWTVQITSPHGEYELCVPPAVRREELFQRRTAQFQFSPNRISLLQAVER